MTPDPKPARDPEAENEIRKPRTRERKPKTAIQQAAQTVRQESLKRLRRHVPDHVRERFVAVGQVYYFPDGAKAFEDHGRRLSTPSENVEVIASLVAIAEARGWRRLTVHGSEKFRREVWQQAALRGLVVRGYAATPVERARLAQRLARVRPAPTTDRSEERVEPKTHAVNRPPLEGTVIGFGSARYRHASRGPMSYFMTLKTREGERTVWGRDLERAITEGRVRVGDGVTLTLQGRDPVTVRTRAEGEPTVVRSDTRYRNRWTIEKHVRTKASNPATVDVAAALTLKQAELLATQHLKPDERAAFLAAVKTQLGERQARGEAPPTAKLRDAAPDRGVRERTL